MALVELKYYFYSIDFKPFADKKNSFDSRAIGKKVLYDLTNIRTQGKGILIDRNENRKGKPPRELFISGAQIIPADGRVRCSLALIRKGKRPKLKKKGTFNLEDIGDLGEIVEVTHFFVDFNSDLNVICVEQNYNGPSIVDIEYYLKKIARDEMQLARSTDITIHMSDTIERTAEKLQNVLGFNIKIRATNLEKINKELGDHYFRSFGVVSQIYKPEFLRVEAFFKKQGKKMKPHKENKMATNMFSKALDVFKSQPKQTDYYDQFDVVFEDGAGNEETFNLLKNKKVVVKEVPEDEDLSLRKSYELVSADISEFVSGM